MGERADGRGRSRCRTVHRHLSSNRATGSSSEGVTSVAAREWYRTAQSGEEMPPPTSFPVFADSPGALTTEAAPPRVSVMES